jgi:uncharacterized membrane protein (UPF0127 family)
MKTIALHTDDGRSVARQVYLATSWAERARGLLNRRTLDDDEGLLLSPGRSIHTVGMHFPIDVVFLNRQMRVLDLAVHVQPWSLRLAPFGTRHVLELPAGRLAAIGPMKDAYLLVEHSTAATKCLHREALRAARSNCSSTLQFSLRLPAIRERREP